ncbi:Hypothetical_protein [Hexamita inflata]|uniref:Hypothetical_protein n=1 Tax=Hexamita inflata TaxID=28002 RepID=A0AA86Q4E9_9EUKA|nr:Hypothetical protein HINF_LOCUS39740 [Hexamita inflata]
MIFVFYQLNTQSLYQKKKQVKEYQRQFLENYGKIYRQHIQTLENSQSTTGNIPRNQELAKTNKLKMNIQTQLRTMHQRQPSNNANTTEQPLVFIRQFVQLIVKNLLTNTNQYEYSKSLNTSFEYPDLKKQLIQIIICADHQQNKNGLESKQLDGHWCEPRQRRYYLRLRYFNQKRLKIRGNVFAVKIQQIRNF